MKRSLDDEEGLAPHIPVKRRRADPEWRDRLSSLSHELALRILSHLTVPELVVCNRVSQHFDDLASDSQLWKAHYYMRFVQPRAARIPGSKEARQLYFSSKTSQWLDEVNLVKRGREVNWKRQYKLRDNWSKGNCSVSEVAVSKEASVPPLLVQMHDSTIYMADKQDGLRAWTSAAGHDMLATISWKTIPEHNAQAPPTSLAVDSSTATTMTLVGVGFQDGSFCVLQLDRLRRRFLHAYRHQPPPNGMLCAMAMSYPFLATMTATQLLSVYRFPDLQEPTPILAAPTLVHSLHSHTIHPPSTLSIRSTPTKVLISIAFALPTYLTGWTIGVQELHLCPTTSSLITTRLATAACAQMSPFLSQRQTPCLPAPFLKPVQPASLSYTHPYLLASHRDNTLTLHLVTSTATDLSLSPPRLLWGHTSAVAGTSVGARGRAVSVSRRGDEVRLWDLEGRVSSAGGNSNSSSSCPGFFAAPGPDDGSVRVVPGGGRGGEPCALEARRHQQGNSGLAIGRMRESLSSQQGQVDIARGWVGFDEENVVLLKERLGCGQSLVVYEFA